MEQIERKEVNKVNAKAKKKYGKIYVDLDLYKKSKIKAAEIGKPLTELATKALEKYLEEMESHE